MKLLWLTILSAIVVALASLYLSSRPQLDRSLVDRAPNTTTGSVDQAVPLRADKPRTGDEAASQQSAASTKATASTSTSGAPPRSSASQGTAVPLPAVSASVPPSRPSAALAGPVAGSDSADVALRPDRAAQRPAARLLDSPAPSRLPRAERPSSPTSRLASVGTDTPSAVALQAAQCRALAAYLSDLQTRADRAANAGEAAMVFEQRKITYARQGELGCDR